MSMYLCTLYLGNLCCVPVLDDKLAVPYLLAGLQPPLAQPDPGLQLVVINTVIPTN